MKFGQLFIRNLKETYRDPLALGFLLAFPLLFMVVFGAALGGGGTPSYNIAVIDDDRSQLSAAFVDEALAGVPIFQIERLSSADDALASLKLGDLRSYLVIPTGFGEAVGLNWQGTQAPLNLTIIYDEADFSISSQIVSTVSAALHSFARIEIPIYITANPVNIENKPGQMDFLAPGIIVFGLLIMIPTSARIMVRDKEKGYMARLLTTPTRPWEFIMGYSACLALIAVAQIIFFMLFGVLLGMHIVGNIGLAFLIFLLTALASIGIGMVVAALSKSENQAEPMTWLFTMPLAVLSGVWFSISFPPNYIQTIANLFPFAHAVEAARAVLIRGAGFAAIQGDIIFLAVWALAVTLLGVFFFGRTMKN